MMQIKGFESYIIKYENKYDNNETNSNRKISFLLFNPYFIIE